MTAVFLLMTQFNFINNHWGLILIYSAQAPMGYMVQKGFFDTIPSSIDEAARLDGATNFQVFAKIILPLSKPILVYTALTSFTWPWSDFILPQLLLPTMDNWTVAVGLMYLDETEFARFAAGSIFIAVPIVILYFCLVKYNGQRDVGRRRQRVSSSSAHGGAFFPPFAPPRANFIRKVRLGGSPLRAAKTVLHKGCLSIGQPFSYYLNRNILPARLTGRKNSSIL